MTALGAAVTLAVVVDVLASLHEALARRWGVPPGPAPLPDNLADAALEPLSARILAGYAELERDDLRRDPVHLASWDALRDSVAEVFEVARGLVDIRFVPFESYTSPADIVADLQRGRLEISTLHCVHPVWSVEENCQFRVAHDLIAHVYAARPFTLLGEYQAFHDHLRVTPTAAWQALFTEVCVYASMRYHGTGYPEVQRAVAFPGLFAAYQAEFMAAA